MHPRTTPNGVTPASPLPAPPARTTLQEKLRACMRRLSAGVPKREGRRQDWRVKDVCRGNLDPCLTMERALDDLIARAGCREQAEEVLALPWILDGHLRERIEARFGGAALVVPIGVAFERSTREVRGPAQASRLRALAERTAGALHECRAWLLRERAALETEIAAADAELVEVARRRGHLALLK